MTNPNSLITQSPDNPKVVFFGSSKYVIPIIEMLRKNFDLALVLTTEEVLQGDPLQRSPIRHYCETSHIPCQSIKQFNNETIQQLKKVQAPLGVLAYFGLILPEEILNIFPKGILNTHPSLLPKYRGPTPGQTAILEAELETGVTLIKLDKEVDHGPMLAQVKETIKKDDTAETLYSRLFAIGAKLLEKNVEDYLNNKITLIEQGHSDATFTTHLTRQSGYIDISRPPLPDQLDRMIRAYHPWPGVWTLLRIKASEGQAKEKIVKFLPEKKVQVEGKKPMSYKDFINGYPGSSHVILNLIADLMEI